MNRRAQLLSFLALPVAARFAPAVAPPIGARPWSSFTGPVTVRAGDTVQITWRITSNESGQTVEAVKTALINREGRVRLHRQR